MPGKVIPIFAMGDYERYTSEASVVLREGGVVILPTETVYGAAGMLASETARQRLRALRTGDAAVKDEPPGGTDKETPPEKPLTLHLSDPAEAKMFLGDLTEMGQRMVRKLWPGPVGLVFEVSADRRREVAKRLKLPESELYFPDGTIVLRCPDHIIARDVIAGARGPVVLTQAPTSSGGPALRADELSESARASADLVIDAGPSRYTKPSTLVRVKARGYEMVRVGVYDQRIIDRMLKTTILFVCSGNTCRSPMAWALTRKRLAESLGVEESGLEEQGFNVVSAGTFAMPGAKATPQAVEAVQELGADLGKHRSRPLSVELVHQADVIFTMGRGHRSAVLGMVPSAGEKVKMLDPTGADIEDPIGSDVGVYRTLAASMDQMVRRRVSEIRDAGSGGGGDKVPGETPGGPAR